MDPLIMKGMEAKLDKLPSKEKFQAPDPRKAFQVSILFYPWYRLQSRTLEIRNFKFQSQ